MSSKFRVTAIALSGWVALAIVLAFNFYSSVSARPSMMPASTSGAAVTGPDQNGYFWVQKRAAAWPGSDGTGAVGQAVLQVNRPGAYRFYYNVNNNPITPVTSSS